MNALKPQSMPGARHYLSAPPDWDAGRHGPCHGLSVLMRDGVGISKWGLNWRQRLRLLFGGAIYLHVMSEDTHPPVALIVE